MAISIGIIFGILSMIGLGLNAALAKVPVVKIGPHRTVFFRDMGTSVLLFISLLFFLNSAVFSPLYIAIAFIISFLGYVPLVTFYKAMRVGKIGVVVPVSNSAVVFTVLFSVIFFMEQLSIVQVFSILLIVIGIVVISVNFKDLRKSQLFKFSSGIPYALATCLLWGLVFFLFKIPVMVIGPILTALIIELGGMFFSGIAIATRKESFRLPDRRILKYIILVAISGAAGTLFFNMGVQIADVSIVAALTFSNPWITTIYGRFVYKEKLKTAQYLAILFILSGIVLISYF